MRKSDLIACSGATVERSASDLLGWPLIGRLMLSTNALWMVRMVILVLFAVAIGYGVALPDRADNAVTTGFFWGLFWPFFMMVTLATLGPVICTVCPHGFIGTTLTRWGLRKPMPKSLRNPFIGLGLILIGYWLLYYLFTPFKSPGFTALFFIVLTLFAIASFLIFDGMAYCKYLCPMGALKSAFGKLGFVRISSDKAGCKGCKTFDCAKVCDVGLSPFNFEKNANMEDCTLCMSCAQSCPSISWKLGKPSWSLLGPIKRMKSVDIWAYILLLATISITMRFHHAMGRTAVADSLPWTVTARWLEGIFPSLVAAGVDSVGFVALLMALALTIAVTLGGIGAAAKIMQQPYRPTLQILGYALAPLVVIGSLSHVGEFFFLHYYHEIGNAALQLLQFDGKIEPLARRGEPWLHSFKGFQYLATAWSYYLFYRRLQLIDTQAWRRWAALPLASAITTLYIGLLLYTGYLFSTYGAMVHHH